MPGHQTLLLALSAKCKPFADAAFMPTKVRTPVLRAPWTRLRHPPSAALDSASSAKKGASTCVTSANADDATTDAVNDVEHDRHCMENSSTDDDDLLRIANNAIKRKFPDRADMLAVNACVKKALSSAMCARK